MSFTLSVRAPGHEAQRPATSFLMRAKLFGPDPAAKVRIVDVVRDEDGSSRSSSSSSSSSASGHESFDEYWHGHDDDDDTDWASESCKSPFPLVVVERAMRKEVARRMWSPTPTALDRVMRDCVAMFGRRWVTLESICAVVLHHGYALSPFRPWVLYTCSRTFHQRAALLGDLPWGCCLPYFVMSPHSEHHESMFRLSPAFLYIVQLLRTEQQQQQQQQ